MSPVKEPSLKDLLNAVGVDKVIWIDDDFAQTDPEAQKLRIQELLSNLHASKLNPGHPALAEITHDLPEGVRETKISKTLGEQTANFVAIIESLTQQLPNESQEGLEAAIELTPVQLAALKAALDNVQTLSFKQWSTTKTQVLGTCTEKTLFLIDRQFSKEGLGDEGDGILVELKQQGKYHCIMLTRTRPGEGAEALRHKIVQESGGGLSVSDFSVMSKSQVGATPEEAKREFCQACRVVFTHRHCHKIAEIIGTVMKASIGTTIEELINHSVYDLDRAIYENSLQEGASELDVVTRILLLQQRVAAQNRFIAEPSLLPELGQLRALRLMSTLEKPSDIGSSHTARLQQWKRQETLETRETINKLHSSLACGDIFQEVGTDRRYVLLVQPCDVTVRGATGERKANEGVFLALQTKRPNASESKTRFYEIENLEENGESWYFDFLKSASVSLDVLELAVFNESGLVQISKTQKPQEFWLAGWKKRFERTVNKVKSLSALKKESPKTLAYLSLNADLPSREGNWSGDGKSWVFNFQRIGRLRSPFAEALLGSFAAYQSRAAFDHDFAFGLSSEKETVEKSESTKAAGEPQGSGAVEESSDKTRASAGAIPENKMETSDTVKDEKIVPPQNPEAKPDDKKAT